MTEHPGLADGIVAPAFTPAAFAPDHHTAAANHLRVCASCRATLDGVRGDAAAIARVDVGEPAPWVRARISRAASRSPGGWLGPLRLLGVALLCVALGGAAAAVGGLLSQVRDDPAAPLPASLQQLVAGKSIAWRAKGALLAADAVTVTANGRVIPAVVPAQGVDGDPGTLTSSTLELTWGSGGLQQRINLYFAADAVNWQIREVRTYDNVGPQPDWATFDAPGGRWALGTPFQGDLHLVGKGRAGEVRLDILGGVILMTPQRSFVDPAVGGGPLLSDPFEAGGTLRCSGILQMPPLAADAELDRLGIRRSWRFEWSTGANTGYSELRLAPPATGWINNTALGSDGELILFVADPTRPFGGGPIPLPADCPPPSQAP